MFKEIVTRLRAEPFQPFSIIAPSGYRWPVGDPGDVNIIGPGARAMVRKARGPGSDIIALDDPQLRLDP